MSVDRGVYDSPESERPIFLDVAPGMTVIVKNDYLTGEKQDKVWWMEQVIVIHCGGALGWRQSAHDEPYWFVMHKKPGATKPRTSTHHKQAVS
nr:DUF3104 domain-containing protein [Synechococcus sp. MIT S9508]